MQVIFSRVIINGNYKQWIAKHTSQKSNCYHEDSLKNSLNLGYSFIAVNKSCSRQDDSCVRQAGFTSCGLNHAIPRRRKGKAQLVDRLSSTVEMGTDSGAVLSPSLIPGSNRDRLSKAISHGPKIMPNVPCT